MRDNRNVAPEPVSVSHAEALRLIDERLGERAYLGIRVALAEGASKDRAVSFVETHGRLSNPLAHDPPRLDPDVGYYAFGSAASEAYPFPPMAGTIRLRDHGLDFLVAEGVSIRVAWRGSSEVGEGPDAGSLARLRILGVASVDSDRGDDASVELQRFLAEAREAPGEILQATPTDFTFEDELGGPMRIWDVRVRVLPEGEQPFETNVEVPWRQVKEIEERLEQGELLTGVSAETQTLRVAFEPSDHGQAMVLPDASGDAPPPPGFTHWIAGGRSKEPPLQ